jgi:hypothetical protein
MPSLDLFGNDEGKSVIERFVDDLTEMIVKIEVKGKGIDSKLGRIGGISSQNMGMKRKIVCSFIIIFVIIIIIIIAIIIIKFTAKK